MPALLLAYDTLKDPRDLAEVLHLAAGFGADVHLIGKGLDPRHWKALRKLRSWRPSLADAPGEIQVERFADVTSWLGEMRSLKIKVAATVLAGGEPPRLDKASGPTAVLFGEESHGLAPEIAALADERWTLPLGPGGRFYTLGQATALILGGSFR